MNDSWLFDIDWQLAVTGDVAGWEHKIEVGTRVKVTSKTKFDHHIGYDVEVMSGTWAGIMRSVAQMDLEPWLPPPSEDEMILLYKSLGVERG